MMKRHQGFHWITFIAVMLFLTASSRPALTGATGNESPQSVAAAGVASGIPGLAIAIQRGESDVTTAAAGSSDLENKTSLSPDDRFGIYSITKVFTATIVLQLVDKGRLSLNDPVISRLSDPTAARIPNIDTITIEQLLRHTSGIYDYFADDGTFLQDAYLGPNADWTKRWTPQELIAYADGAKHDANFAPGAGNEYSNTNYGLLGMIIEQTTGQTFAQELHLRITGPLGMANTFFAPEEAITGGRVQSYQRIDDQLVNVSQIDLSSAWTAGGIVSTVGDLMSFSRAIQSRELLSAASGAAMFDFQSTGKPGFDEGIGIFRQETPYGVIEAMDGDGPGFTSLMGWQPDGGFSFVLLANIAPGGELFDNVRTALLDAELGGSATPVATPTD